MARIKMWFCDELKDEIKLLFHKVVFSGERLNVYYLLQGYSPRVNTYALFIVFQGQLVKIAAGLRYSGGGYNKVDAAIEDTVKYFLCNNNVMTYEQRQAFIKSQSKFIAYCIN